MKRVLAWSDSPTAGTGFGTVALHVLKALVATGQYEVDQIGINYHVASYDQREFPWNIIPARKRDPRDLIGAGSLLEAVRSGTYDFIWILNDAFLVNPVAQELKKAVDNLKVQGKKHPKILFYYTVDCQFRRHEAGIADLADNIIAVSEFGRRETLKTCPHFSNKLQVVPFGVDLASFHPIPAEDRRKIRRDHFNAPDDETFVLINVNRNSPRKQLPQTILAFSEFKKNHPQSRLYLHTQMVEPKYGLDLRLAAADLGLSPKEVIAPLNLSNSNPLPLFALNNAYNAADAFITTSLGEGWGLTHFEAMAIGLPVICPENSVFPELLRNGEAGYLYPCKNKIWVENSGFRPLARTEDIVAAMELVYQEIQENRSKGIPVRELPRVKTAREYAHGLQWSEVVKSWIILFETI